MSLPQPRDRVVHPQHGPGTVVARVVGDNARVRFDSAPLLPRRVRLATLASLARGRPTREAGLATPPRPRAARAGASTCRVRDAGPSGPPSLAPGDDGNLRQTIESLRLGVVPFAHARDYTVGRDAELQALDALLAAGQGMRIVVGDYGTGKTHLLDVIEQVALGAGWATSRVVLDPREVRASHPQRIYRAVLRGLRYPEDGGAGLEPLLDRLAGSPDHAKPRRRRYSRFLTPVLFARRSGRGEAIDWLSDYIEGYPMFPGDVDRVLRWIGWRGDHVLALSDFRTYGRVYVHILGTLATWLRDAGFRGLLLLFDEMDRVDLLNAANLDLADEVLAHFAAVTLPREAIGFDPEKGLYRGGHSVHRRLPLRFEEDQPLSVVMALTPAPMIGAMIDRRISSREVRIDLAPLGRRAFGEMIRRVEGIYLRAHPGGWADKERVRVLRGKVIAGVPRDGAVPREVVRRTVNLLDCERLGLLGQWKGA